MYSIEDLFDKRSVVGIRIESILRDRHLTKAELSQNAGVSRPTIDKLMDGTLTSKTNYEKHVKKILNYLQLSPDKLLGNACNVYSRTREAKSILRISTELISEMTGISVERIKQIEMGEEATISELRDIALCLSTSVKDLQGENVFEPQIASLDLIVRKGGSKKLGEFNGFWGHVGILLQGQKKYMWYPITGNTREYIYRTMSDNRLVVQCMNNKLLYLNMSEIKEIALLDDACDAPHNINWSRQVSEGEIPLVVYEALEEYDEGTKDDRELYSGWFCTFLDELIEKYKWDEGKIYYMLNDTNIYFKDGRVRTITADFTESDTVTEEVMDVYDFGDDAFLDNNILFYDTNGMECIINTKKVAMIEFPLLKIERAMIEKIKSE